jgi:pyridoxamine 5'-phosphate oxidase
MSLQDRRIQYETEGLERNDLQDDPFVQWNAWYEQAASAGVAEPNAMSVATIAADGIPDARIVLARQVDANGLVFYTNYTSDKSAQLESQPVASAVFSWLDLHRQVRVRGSVRRVSDAQSDEYFASRPRESQLGAWASPQSQVISDRSVLAERLEQFRQQFDGVDVPRPPMWGGWVIEPVAFEFWQGRPSRLHDRFRYSRTTVTSTVWSIDRLAP